MHERKNYISWDQYFMGIAKISAMRSKDPRTQVGACIVDASNRILSMGYNGMPRGCGDAVFPWGRTAERQEDTKYPYVVHAELNAILNYRGGNLEGSILYVTMFPCNECAKAIIQSGIKKIVYDKEFRHDFASKRMLTAAGVACEKYSDDYIGIITKNRASENIINTYCASCHTQDGCKSCQINGALEELKRTEEIM